MSSLTDLGSFADVSAIAGTIAAGAAAVVGAFSSAIFSRRNSRNPIDQPELERIRDEITKTKAGTPIPFEIEQLASYYALTLGQARVSFWFSLVFASIGFVVIVSAAIFYREGDYVSASIKVTSGLVIDAVSALFFVQSRRAQESMSAFFEKLRNDRQFAEARKICDEVSDEKIQNRLKTILVLHYSNIDAAPIVATLLGETKEVQAPIVTTLLGENKEVHNP